MPVKEIRSRILKSEPVEWKKFEFLQTESFKELSKEAYQKIKESILRNGFAESFKVWQNGRKLYCLDGYHRCKVLSDLEREGVKVPAKFHADFLACKNQKEAAKLVLIYSSIYAHITDEGLYEFQPQARKKTKAGTTQSAAERKRKERIAKAKKICQVYACGIHTIASCCESEGVSYDIFYEWGEQYPEIRELYKNAKETHRKKRFDGLAEKALNSFERLIAGYDYEETHTEALPAADGKKMIVRLVRKVTKHFTPHPGMVAMAMKNWHGMKDVQQLEHSGEITTRQVMEIGGQRVEF